MFKRGDALCDVQKVTVWPRSDRRTGNRAVLFAVLMLAATLPAMAQVGGATVQTEEGKLVRASRSAAVLGPDLFGDKINFYNGALEFIQTDITIPGNSSLPVSVGRRMVTGGRGNEGKGLFRNWDLEIPHISGMFSTVYGWTKLDANKAPSVARCTNFGEPPPVFRSSKELTKFRPAEYWQGNHLYVPGKGGQEILRRNEAYNANIPSDGLPTLLVTRDAWAIRCLPTLASTDAATPANEAGEGFLAISPDGTQYRFDWLVSRPMASLSKPVHAQGVVAPRPTAAPDHSASPAELPIPNGDGGTSGFTMDRTEVHIFPTLVTDRHGNTVRYEYDRSRKWKLLSIRSADGAGNSERVLTFTYHPDTSFVETVSDGTRTWRYDYGGNGWGGPSLSTVKLPDGSAWQFAGMDGAQYGTGLVNMFIEYGASDSPSQLCDDEVPAIRSVAVTGSMVHPSGAVGTFMMAPTVHARNGVPALCYSDLPNTPGRAYFPQYYGVYSVTSKTITGPGIGTLAWSMQYDTFNPGRADCTTCAVPSHVSVTDPRGDVTRYTFGSTFGVDEGMVKQVDIGWNGSSAVRSTKTVYNQSFTQPVGFTDQDRGDGRVSARMIPEQERTILQQDVEFTWRVPSVDDFDRFKRPLRVVKSSSLGMSRTETTTYHDNTAEWVLGQVKSVTEASTGRVPILNGYNAATDNLETVTKFGKLEQTMLYHPDGSLATSQDGKGQTTSFDSYKRGLPRITRYADKTSESMTVSDIGLVAAMTNGAGFTTSYDYDSVGRLALISHPTGDSVAWNPTKIDYVQVWTPEHGLEPGHWRQDATTGNARTSTYYDALFRPAVTETVDVGDVGNTARFVTKRHDFNGRVTYTSYPKRSFAEIGSGVHQDYDELGRKRVTGADSELGVLYSGYRYASQFKTVYTTARQTDTVSSYQVFDEPAEEQVRLIELPQGGTVAIDRDVFGKPLAITRSGDGKGATRSYVYDAHQRLCKTIEPETAATVQQYDLANNVVWRASGLALLSNTACDQASVNAARKIVFEYDARNQLETTTYGDGSAGISRTYTGDGLPLTISSGGTVWTNTYNKRRLNERENLMYGGVAYNIDRKYDANASLLSLTYPDASTTVEYAPNALGEPTRVGSYATAVTYHPNGAIASFRYGNGITHTLKQNTRGIPERSTDAGVLDDVYAYDKNANVASITDALRGVSTRSMAYDDLDRLTSVAAQSTWGSADYGYDALDNMTSSKLTAGGTARTAAHNYDAATNRLSSITSPAAAYNLGYDYDLNGNIVLRGKQAFSFDLSNRLIEAKGKGTYRYDGLGHRVSVVGVDGVNRVQVYSQGGQMLFAKATSVPLAAGTKYIYLHRHLVAEDSAGSIQYDHTDGLGSPVARSDGKGAVVSRTHYEAYGLTAAGNVPTIGFGGHVNAADIGLVYMQQRYYDPVAGRMMSIDPVATDASKGSSFNRYSYASNNPYKYIDPDGRDERRAYGAGVGIGAGLAGMSKRDIEIWKRAEGNATTEGGAAVNGFDSVYGVIETIRPEATPARSRNPQFKVDVWADNRAKNWGQAKCDDCKIDVKPGVKLEKGDKVPSNRGAAHHKVEFAKGGADDGTKNGELLCENCHKVRHK